MRNVNPDDPGIPNRPNPTIPPLSNKFQGQHVVAWFHDESIFYAHDHQRRAWFHKDAPILPYIKGKGLSLMIAHAISADYGWLVGRDGSQAAQ